MLDIYGSLDSAGHSLKRMWLRQIVHRVGLLCESELGGRPLYVYCTRRIKVDNLAHEVGLTRVILALEPNQSVRGEKVDQTLRPDAQLTFGDQQLLLEYDTGSMAIRQVRETRFQRVYADYAQPVLWVCKDEERCDELRAAAKSVAHNAWFSTEAAVIADPFGMVWTEFSGKRSSIHAVLSREKLLTRLLEAFATYCPVRLDQTADNYRPDAELRIGNKTVYLECDREHLSTQEVRATRFHHVYEGLRDPVLYVCKDDVRREQLRMAARGVADRVWFATEMAVIADPFGVVWIDCEGKPCQI